MPRPSTFFRLENVSKDSGLSFHCCGKPEDLRDEPLGYVNEKRRLGNVRPFDVKEKINQRQLDSLLVSTLCNEHRLKKEKQGTVELSSPPSRSWPRQPFAFRSTACSSNLKPKPRAQKAKLWAKKSTPESHEAFQKKAHQGVQLINDESSKENNTPRLRSVRSMPFLNEDTPPNATANRRLRSKRLSSLCLSGFNSLVRPDCNQDKMLEQEARPSTCIAVPYYRDSYFATQSGSAKTNSSKNISISSKKSRTPSFFSISNWSNFFSHRQDKTKKFE